MRRALVGLVVVGLALFAGALVVLRQRPKPGAPDPDAVREPPDPPPMRRRPATPEPEPEPEQTAVPAFPSPPGLRLGDGAAPDAHVEARAILEASLRELQRLDGSQRELARDVYMRGHSAAERVEDELDEDDEPGRARLRADEDAMKDELRRIYGVAEVTARP